jgi:hypothetical protein
VNGAVGLSKLFKYSAMMSGATFGAGFGGKN